MPIEKPHKTINCKNRLCNEFLCHSDGRFLFVENLEIMPKVKKNTNRPQSGRIIKTIECPKCVWETKVGLKKTLPEEKPQPQSGRKFLIFRSRF